MSAASRVPFVWRAVEACRGGVLAQQLGDASAVSAREAGGDDVPGHQVVNERPGDSARAVGVAQEDAFIFEGSKKALLPAAVGVLAQLSRPGVRKVACLVLPEGVSQSVECLVDVVGVDGWDEFVDAAGSGGEVLVENSGEGARQACSAHGLSAVAVGHGAVDLSVSGWLRSSRGRPAPPGSIL